MLMETVAEPKHFTIGGECAMNPAGAVPELRNDEEEAR